MFDDDALEQRRSHATVPNTVGIYDDNRAAGTDAEAGCFAALYPIRPEEQSLTLEQCRQLRIELAPTTIRRAKPADTHEYVSRVRLEKWLGEIHRLR